MFKLISDVTFVVSLSGEMTNQGADNFFILIGCSVLLAVLGFVVMWCFLSKK